MHNRRALVTGAAGFIGSHVVDELLDLGCAVVALDDLSGGFVDNVDERASFDRPKLEVSSALASRFRESLLTNPCCGQCPKITRSTYQSSRADS